MRTSEITTKVSSTTITGSISYPDEVCFVFNPLFIDAKLQIPTSAIEFTLKIAIEDLSIEAVLYQSGSSTDYRSKSAKIYISRILQMMFTDYLSERSKQIEIKVSINTVEVLSFTTTCIWGNLALGDRFNSFGAFAYDKNEKLHFERNLIWFRNFPFRVSMYRHSNEELLAKYDKNVYDEKLFIKRGVFHSINDSESLPEYNNTDSYIGDIKIIYFTKHKLFLAISSETSTYYINWGVGLGKDYVPDCTQYNDESSGTVRTDVEWILNGIVYKYDTGSEMLISIDNNKHWSNRNGIIELEPAYSFPEAKTKATYKIKGEGKGFSLFDSTFDYTFFSSNESSVIVNLRINNERDGYYIRWIDRFGFIQYYLFAKGKTTIKTKSSNIQLPVEKLSNGIYFANCIRTCSIETTKTVKCCAVNLPTSILEYVESIVSSPVTDLYLGKNKEGQEVWVPIQIIDGSYVIEPNKILRDFEISFTYPNVTTQIL